MSESMGKWRNVEISILDYFQLQFSSLFGSCLIMKRTNKSSFSIFFSRILDSVFFSRIIDIQKIRAFVRAFCFSFSRHPNKQVKERRKILYSVTFSATADLGKKNDGDSTTFYCRRVWSEFTKMGLWRTIFVFRNVWHNYKEPGHVPQVRTVISGFCGGSLLSLFRRDAMRVSGG